MKQHSAVAPIPELRGPGGSLSRAIAQRLATTILSGERVPGEVLPGEVDAADAFAVSRSAYREAIQVLAAKGLVESRRKAGTRVLPRTRWNLFDPDVLAWAFIGEPDPQLIRELFDLRSIVEPGAARLAAQRRRPDDIQALEKALAAMTRHTLATEAGRNADGDFHQAILRATGNDALLFLGAGIGAAVTWTTAFKQRNRALPRDPIPAHACVCRAIAMGDPDEAERTMRALVEMAWADTREAMTY